MSDTDTSRRKTPQVKYEVYRVGQGILHFLGPAEASNDIGAIKQVLGDQPQEGKYVAVPLRVMRVRDVGIETQPKVVIK